VTAEQGSGGASGDGQRLRPRRLGHGGLAVTGRERLRAVEDEPALDGAIVTRLLALDGLVMGVGGRSTDPDHTIGVVWLIAPD
jgi:hypothetical protein